MPTIPKWKPTAQGVCKQSQHSAFQKTIPVQNSHLRPASAPWTHLYVIKHLGGGIAEQHGFQARGNCALSPIVRWTHRAQLLYRVLVWNTQTNQKT